jgi:ankyrin repeat protein
MVKTNAQNRFVPESRGAVKNLERKRRTPTMIAALHGSLEVLGYILQAGADPNVRSEDDERFTAMHCAASGGSAMVGLQCTRHNAFCCPKDASCLAPQALVGDLTQRHDTR